MRCRSTRRWRGHGAWGGRRGEVKNRQDRRLGVTTVVSIETSMAWARSVQQRSRLHASLRCNIGIADSAWLWLPLMFTEMHQYTSRSVSSR